jgi:hypothetical protein
MVATRAGAGAEYYNYPLGPGEVCALYNCQDAITQLG